MSANNHYPCVVYSGGYEVISPSRENGRFRGDDDRYIVPKEAGYTPLHQLQHRLYDPMDSEHSTSYIDFANLAAGNEVAITDFVNRHGLLTAPEHWAQVQDTTQRNRKPVMGEAVLIWSVESATMKVALDLLSAVSRNDTHYLSEHIKAKKEETPFDGSTYISLCSSDDEAVYSVPESAVANLTHFQIGRYFLAALIHGRLMGDVHPVVTFDPKQGFQTDFAPSTLLSALWLRFAYDLQDVKKLKWCAYCGQNIKLKKGMYSNRKYCDDNCKAKGAPSYRARHKPKGKL